MVSLNVDAIGTTSAPGTLLPILGTRPDLARGQTAVELCAGMGGIGIGLRALGYDVLRAYDSWDQAVAIYNHNARRDVAQVCNLVGASGRASIVAAKQELGDIDLVAAGPPCKGFSQLRNGRHHGPNPHNRVLAAIPSYLAILRPRSFLIENVPDLLRHNEGRTFKVLMGALERPCNGLRYRISFQIYDAASYGTPQSRKRVLIFGTRGRVSAGVLPSPGPDLTALYTALRKGNSVPAALAAYVEFLKDPQDPRLTTAEQALSDLPALNAGEMADELEYEKLPESAYQLWARVGATSMVRNVRTPRVTPAASARLGHVDPGGCVSKIPAEHLNGLARRYHSAYRRLHPDAPSTALSTKYDCVYHYARTRSLSVREYARLQAVPDWFTFPAEVACRRSAYEMIGNSVPPPLIEGVLGQTLLGGA